MSDEKAVNALAESWASIDGKLDAYNRERGVRVNDGLRNLGFTGAYEGYQAEAEEMMRRLAKRGFKIVPINVWQDIKTAPTLDRVFVSGWQAPNGSVAGYWWVHEDCTDEAGRPIDYPDAALWQPVPARPEEPPSAS